MSSISERLEEYFFKMPYDEVDQKLISYITMSDKECEKLYEEQPHLFNQYLNKIDIDEPQTESEEEDIQNNIKPFKVEELFEDEDEPSTSYRRTRKNSEFSMPFHKGIPNSRNSPNAINILNIDCISDLKTRKQIIDKWATEISLIIQTNQDDFIKARSVSLLVEHKTSGIVQNFIRNNTWTEDLHGADLFEAMINIIYTYFLGIDYTSNKLVEIEKRAENARTVLTKLQLSDICFLDQFICIYEKNLYDIPNAHEYAQWITAFLMKIPVIGEQCIERWKKEATNELTKTSLAFAIKIAREEITKICEDRFKQRKLKNISKNCCNIVADFQNLDIGKKSYSKNNKRYKSKKKFKKYRTSWKKKKKKFSPGKYFTKPSKNKDKNCPQGKKKCRCWICSEEGHYANECPNRQKYPDKLKILKTALLDGFHPLEDEFEEEDYIFQISVLTDIEDNSSTDSSDYESNN